MGSTRSYRTRRTDADGEGPRVRDSDYGGGRSTKTQNTEHHSKERKPMTPTAHTMNTGKLGEGTVSRKGLSITADGGWRDGEAV